MPELLPSSTRTWCKVTLFASGFFWALLPLGNACAYDAVTIDSGYGLSDTKLLRLNYSIGDEHRYPTGKGWYWNRSLEGNFSYWYLYNNMKNEGKLLEIGLTPNFRLEPERSWSWGRQYLEMGIGVHLLSETHIGKRHLGSNLQFGTHGGFGVRFGGKEQYDLAWRIEHISNAGIREPNPGINFSMLRLGYRW